MRKLTLQTKLFIATDAVIDGSDLDTGSIPMVVNGAPISVRMFFSAAGAKGWHGIITTAFEGLESNSPFAYILCRQVFDVLALWNVTGFEVFPSVAHAPRIEALPVRESRPVVDVESLKEAFKASTVLGNVSEALTKSLGWYRRGLSSADETLSFLALWNSVEIAAGQFHKKTAQTTKGTKNQIYQAFLDLWEGKNNYAFPEGEKSYVKWIDENYQKRLGIAHGLIPLEPQYLRSLQDARASVIRVASFFLQQLLSQLLKEEDQRMQKARTSARRNEGLVRRSRRLSSMN